jgi:hypothetical protein
VTFVGNDVVLIFDDSKFISLLLRHTPKYCWAWVIEFSLLTTVKLGPLLLRVVTRA